MCLRMDSSCMRSELDNQQIAAEKLRYCLASFFFATLLYLPSFFIGGCDMDMGHSWKLCLQLIPQVLSIHCRKKGCIAGNLLHGSAGKGWAHIFKLATTPLRQCLRQLYDYCPQPRAWPWSYSKQGMSCTVGQWGHLQLL